MFNYGLNQTYESFVNFTNRNGDTNLNKTEFGGLFACATLLSTYAASKIQKYLMCMRHPYMFVSMKIHQI